MLLVYKKNKNGTIQVSQSEYQKVEGIDYVLTKHGKLDGKLTQAWTKLKADKELQPQIDAFLKAKKARLYCEGYNPDLEFVKKNKYNCLPNGTYMCSLLQKMDSPLDLSLSKTLVKLLNKYMYCYLQPKLNGYRCNAYRTHLQSRFGVEFKLDYIKDEISKLFTVLANENAKVFFDGELYCHGKSLEEIGSMVKNGADGLKLVIYDIGVEEYTFEQRWQLLELLFKENKFEHLELNKTVTINSIAEAQNEHNMNVQDNYEGSVLKVPEGNYEFGYRSNYLWKIKPRQTAEFLCVGQYSRKKEDECTLVMLTAEGNKFSACLAATSDERKKLKEEFKEKWENKMVTVEFRGYTGKNKLPCEATVIGLRDVESNEL